MAHRQTDVEAAFQPVVVVIMLRGCGCVDHNERRQRQSRLAATFVLMRIYLLAVGSIVMPPENGIRPKLQVRISVSAQLRKCRREVTPVGIPQTALSSLGLGCTLGLPAPSNGADRDERNSHSFSQTTNNPLTPVGGQIRKYKYRIQSAGWGT